MPLLSRTRRACMRNSCVAQRIGAPALHPKPFMRPQLSFTIAALLVVSFVTPAAAQRRTPARTPAADMWAVGGSIGPTTPSDASLDRGVDLVGNAEYYITPRV